MKKKVRRRIVVLLKVLLVVLILGFIYWIDDITIIVGVVYSRGSI